MNAITEINPSKLFASAPNSVNFKKLRKRLARQTQTVIGDYGLVDRYAVTTGSKPKPKWLVCLSGGKDSFGLLAVLLDLQWQGALPVDLLACNLDQGQPGFPKHILPDWLDNIGVNYRIETQDTYSIVTEKVPEHKTFCALCSRLRRGILYRIAREEKCDAIILGHHRDDALETFMLNLLYGARIAAMPPKLLNDAGDVFVHRPLIGCAESDLRKFSEAMKFPIIPCNLCGSQDGLQRQAMKKMLDEWESRKPGTRQIMATALTTVRLSHLHDAKLFDFAGLAIGHAGQSDDGVPF
ncbi:MAG: tRNA 2-thiocytidine(32) synthetase TtcA [Hellea sp.]|nr:tRNA 2-thiocytidine(32) synthetase TtcA [Hellea sp.]